VHFRVSGFQALPAEALAKAGFQSFKVSGFASRSFSEGWVSKFQSFRLCQPYAGSRKPVAANR